MLRRDGGYSVRFAVLVPPRFGGLNAVSKFGALRDAPPVPEASLHERVIGACTFICSWHPLACNLHLQHVQ